MPIFFFIELLTKWASYAMPFTITQYLYFLIDKYPSRLKSTKKNEYSTAAYVNSDKLLLETRQRQKHHRHLRNPRILYMKIQPELDDIFDRHFIN